MSDKIQTLEAEIERLKVELENERRSATGVPTRGRYTMSCKGTPIDFGKVFEPDERTLLNTFVSEASVRKHAEMLLTWRRAIMDNFAGFPVAIETFLPLLPKGWVAMDETGDWFYFDDYPRLFRRSGYGGWESKSGVCTPLSAFNIQPADEWEESRLECGF